jgi:DNA modification methylase
VKAQFLAFTFVWEYNANRERNSGIVLLGRQLPELLSTAVSKMRRPTSHIRRLKLRFKWRGGAELTAFLDETALFNEVLVEENAWHGNSIGGVNWHVYTGDARQILASLDKESVDCVITSPPYYNLRDYGVDGQIGLEETVQEFVNSLSDVMDEVYRVLKRDGVLFLNIGDTYYSGKGASQGKDQKSRKRRFGLRPVDKSGGVGIGIQKKSIIGIPWRVAIEMCNRKWVLRSPIVWHRQGRLNEVVIDRPRRSYEYVFMFVKSRKYFFNRQPLLDQKVEEDMWTITARPKSVAGINTAPFPDQLVERCLEIGCPPEGIVLDPFAGSGTTVRVAVSSGRPAIGIDLNEAFCEHIVKSLRRI